MPALVISLRLDRPPLSPDSQGGAAAYYGSVLPGVWSFQLAARARGIGSAWTTFHLEHEAEIAERLGVTLLDIRQAHVGTDRSRVLIQRLLDEGALVEVDRTRPQTRRVESARRALGLALGARQRQTAQGVRHT